MDDISKKLAKVKRDASLVSEYEDITAFLDFLKGERVKADLVTFRFVQENSGFKSYKISDKNNLSELALCGIEETFKKRLEAILINLKG